MLTLVVSITALVAAALTFVSGFGLGTLLLPAFALFVSVEIAIAATACVHLANNILKFFLTVRHADRSVLVRFGIAAAAASIAGALLQRKLAELPDVLAYQLGGVERIITPVHLGLGVVIMCFAALELSPRFSTLEFDRSKLPIGGAISGFFGGLSGHQGALRAAFLVRCGLTKEALIATGVFCSVLVDVPRLGVYATRITPHAEELKQLVVPLSAGCAAAFVGTMIGSKVVTKMTIGAVRVTIGIALLGFGLAMASGFVR